MNAATAAGILGEPVDATVIHTSKTSDDATCNFTPPRPGATSVLHIAVITLTNSGQEFPAYKRQCGSNPIALQAIGNEAIECIIDTAAGQSIQVVGRVRNRVFLVNICVPIRNGASHPERDRLENARKIAEQVSETLY